MNILLIEPNYSSKRFSPPIGLGFIAAILKKNKIPYTLLDFSLLKPSRRLCEELIRSATPDLIGISCNPWSYYQAVTVAKMCKKHFPDICLVMGGIHAGWDKENLLTNIPEVDVLFSGESEVSFLNFYNKLQENKIEEVHGISYRKENVIIHNPPAVLIKDIDSLPSPYIEGVFELKYYNTVNLSTARGCPMSCIFCSWGSKKDSGIFRQHSIDRVIEELHIIKHAGILNIIPCEGTFNASPKRMRQLCRRIKEEGIEFNWLDVDMSANFISFQDLQLLKEMGCTEVGFGYESCHPETQKRIRKNLKIDRFSQAVKWALELNLKVHAGMIVGLPGETEEDVKESFNFLMNTGLSEMGIFELRLQAGYIFI